MMRAWRLEKLRHLMTLKSCDPSGRRGRCLRNALLAVCVAQLLTTLERQIFDFLGYMWTPILFNFLHSLFAIFGIFGTWTRRKGYVVAFIAWSLVSCLWNLFVVCLYLQVGTLTTELGERILSLDTGSYSWWWANGAFCRPKYSTNSTLSAAEDGYRPLKPVAVEGCLLDYRYVETLHAGIQIVLACVSMPLAIFHLRLPPDEDVVFDRASSYGQKPPPSSLYSLEMSSRGAGVGANGEDTLKLGASASDLDIDSASGYDPRLTPRRIKRRSGARVSARSGGSRSSRSSRSSKRRLRSRDRVRASNTNPYSINPIDNLDTSSNDETYRHHRLGHINQAYQTSRPGSVYSFTTATSMEFGTSLSRPKSALSAYSNFHPARNAQLNAANLAKFGTQSSNHSSGLRNIAGPVLNPASNLLLHNLNRFAHSPEMPRRAVSHHPNGATGQAPGVMMGDRRFQLSYASHSETPI